MNRETNRAALAARFKSSFHADDSIEELKIYSRIMSDVYFRQQENEKSQRHVHITYNPNLPQKYASQ